jgi:hypothetical protein
VAKKEIANIMDPEDLRDLGVEEVKYDPAKKHWLITLGFNRPWNVIRGERPLRWPGQTGSISATAGIEPAPVKKRVRTYKTIRIDGAKLP